MNKVLKRILIGIGCALVLFVLSIVVVLNYFEDEVVEFAKGKSKDYFVTKVDFGPAGLTFWKTFPNASLHVQDVYITETFATKDTLIFAKSVYLEFGLIDLFRGKYNVHAIKAENALGRLKVDAKGADNWHFWKASEEESDDFKLQLKKIVLNDTRFSLDNKSSEFYLQLFSKSATGKGNFAGSQFDLDVDIDGRMQHLQVGKEDYAIEKNFTLEGTLDADTDKSVYTFKKNELIIEKMPFVVNGKIDASEKANIDLVINSDDLNLKEVLESLTPVQQARFKDYAASGKVNADIKIKGNTYGKNVPVTDVHCTIKDGTFKHKPSDVKLDELACDLRYVAGEKEDVLSIRNIKSKMAAGYVDLQGIIKNLKKPVLDISLNAETDLDNLKRFFAWDTLEVCSGKISANTKISGTLQYIEADTAYNWKALNTTGTAKLQSAQIKLKNSNRHFSNVQSDIVFDNRDVNVKNLSGEVNGSDFVVNGSVKNLIPFLTTKTEHLHLDAKLNSNNIDFTNLVEASSTSGDEYYFELPERIDFVLNTSVKKFNFRKFEAHDIKGSVNLDGFKLTIDPVSFRTADGNFEAQIAMSKGNDEHYRLNCLAKLKSINIQKLFAEFENFGQSFITDSHLRGITNATVQFKTTVTKGLKILPQKVESLVDISIDNGQLIGLESLQEVAAYVKKNKLAAPFVDADKFAEKLKSISFSRLENVIEIKESTIVIPAMDIKSSALDISARGKHTFDSKIDYTIGFNLRDVLVKKEREYEVQDDGLGRRLFVYMKGTTADPEFGIDKEVAKETRQQERQAEKENVKALLRDELGLFKKNKNTGAYKEEPVQGKTTVTTIEWGDADDNKTISPKQEEKPSVKKSEPATPKQEDGTKKKTPKWLQEKE